jgi:hypothetical protein
MTASTHSPGHAYSAGSMEFRPIWAPTRWPQPLLGGWRVPPDCRETSDGIWAGSARRKPMSCGVPASGPSRRRSPRSRTQSQAFVDVGPARHLDGQTRPPALGRASRLWVSAPGYWSLRRGPVVVVGRSDRPLDTVYGYLAAVAEHHPMPPPRSPSSDSSLRAWGAGTGVCFKLADGPTARSKPVICSPQSMRAFGTVGAPIVGSACVVGRLGGRVGRHYAWLYVGRPTPDFFARSVRPRRV